MMTFVGFKVVENSTAALLESIGIRSVSLHHTRCYVPRCSCHLSSPRIVERRHRHSLVAHLPPDPHNASQRPVPSSYGLPQLPICEFATKSSPQTAWTIVQLLLPHAPSLHPSRNQQNAPYHSCTLTSRERNNCHPRDCDVFRSR